MTSFKYCQAGIMEVSPEHSRRSQSFYQKRGGLFSKSVLVSGSDASAYCSSFSQGTTGFGVWSKKRYVTEEDNRLVTSTCREVVDEITIPVKHVMVTGGSGGYEWPRSSMC